MFGEKVEVCVRENLYEGHCPLARWPSLRLFSETWVLRVHPEWTVSWHKRMYSGTGQRCWVQTRSAPVVSKESWIVPVDIYVTTRGKVTFNAGERWWRWVLQRVWGIHTLHVLVGWPFFVRIGEIMRRREKDLKDLVNFYPWKRLFVFDRERGKCLQSVHNEFLFLWKTLYPGVR